jgi:hypothetical protein
MVGEACRCRACYCMAVMECFGKAALVEASWQVLAVVDLLVQARLRESAQGRFGKACIGLSRTGDARLGKAVLEVLAESRTGKLCLCRVWPLSIGRHVDASPGLATRGWAVTVCRVTASMARQPWRGPAVKVCFVTAWRGWLRPLRNVCSRNCWSRPCCVRPFRNGWVEMVTARRGVFRPFRHVPDAHVSDW